MPLLCRVPLIRTSSLPHPPRPRIQATQARPYHRPLSTSKPPPSPKPRSPLFKPASSRSFFTLPPPRPVATQRYESTMGLVESGVLVCGLVLVGTLYGHANGRVEEVASEVAAVVNVEDRGVHEWIRPFDFVVGEDDLREPERLLEEHGERIADADEVE